MFDISPRSMFSSTFQSISVLAWDSISQRAAQERRWGCCTLLNCCPGRSLLTVMWEASAAPWAPWQTGLQCWGVCQGCFFHKAFYKSVTAPCLPFPPCTHALLSQQAPKELLRNAEPTHKPALLATLVILFLALSFHFSVTRSLACAESRQTATASEGRAGKAALVWGLKLIMKH